MGRQLNQIIEGLSGVTSGTSTINVNLDAIEALLTTLQADVADGLIVTNGTANANLRDGSGNSLTSSARGSQRALSVQIVDGSGNQITSFGSATVDSNTRDGSGNSITSTTSGTSRRLDVMLSSGGTTGSATPTNANLIGGTDGTNLRGLSVDASGRANVNTINQNLTTGSGTLSGTSASGVDVLASTDVSGFAEMALQFTGTWPTSGIVQVQVSNDNTTFVAHTCIQIGQTATASTISAIGIYRISFDGARYIRIRVTTQGSTSSYDYSYTLNPRTSSRLTQPVAISSTINTNSAPTASTTQGVSLGTYSNYLTISVSGTNATNIRNAQCTLYSCNLTNLTSSFKYFKLFNTASTITVGTSTPILTIPIPPNSTIPFDCGAVGARFTNGLGFAITGGLATADTTSVAAGDVVVNLIYV